MTKRVLKYNNLTSMCKIMLEDKGIIEMRAFARQ
jgi:hypothetical protein